MIGEGDRALYCWLAMSPASLIALDAGPLPTIVNNASMAGMRFDSLIL